jgi:F-type H+-transporting ATPase subunit b
MLYGLVVATALTAGWGSALAEGDEAAAPAAIVPEAPAASAPASEGGEGKPKARKRPRTRDKAEVTGAAEAKGPVGKRSRRLALREALEARAADAAATGVAAPTPTGIEAAPKPEYTVSTSLDAGSLDSGLDSSGVDGGSIDTLPAAAAIHQPVEAEHVAAPAGEATHGAQHGEHGKADHGEGEAGEHASFKVGTFILQLLNFGVLLFILIYFGGRKMSKSLRSRHEHLKGDVAEAARQRDEAERKATLQNRRLADLEKEIAALRATMRQDADREQARLLEGAQERAKRIQEEMRFQLDQQVKDAEVALRAEVASAAVKLAEELASKAVDTQDERRFAQDFVAGVDDPSEGGR